jgi:hypothetical protein
LGPALTKRHGLIEEGEKQNKTKTPQEYLCEKSVAEGCSSNTKQKHCKRICDYILDNFM